MIKIKTEPDIRRCFCCYQELLVDYEPPEDGLMNTINYCFAIEIPIKFKDLKPSVCHDCITRLHESYDFKRLILESMDKFESVKFEENLPVKDDPENIPEDIKDSELSSSGTVIIKKEPLEEVQSDCDQFKYELPLEYFMDHGEDKSHTDEASDDDASDCDMDRRNDEWAQSSFPLDPLSKFQDVRVNLIKLEDLCYGFDPIEKSIFGMNSEEMTLIATRETQLVRRVLCDMFDFSNGCEIPFVFDVSSPSHRLLFRHSFSRFRVVRHRQVFHCRECPKSFELRHLLRKHMVRHSKEKNFSCPQCPKSFITSYELNYHLKMHSDVREHKCTRCPRAFLSKYLLDKHMQYHTGDLSFKCPQCPRAFSMNCELKAHTRIHEDVREFKCPLCPKSFKTPNNLREHVKVHDEKQRYDCHLCSKSFKRKRVLTQHMVRHTGAEIWKCPLCNRLFTDSEKFDEHMRLHNEKYNCPLCPKALLSEIGLKNHLERHKDTKKFECSLCSVEFLSKNKLSVHMRIHNGARELKCTLCPRTFITPYKLNRHMKVHSTVGGIQCTQCPEKFITNYKLSRHMKVHELGECANL